MERIDIKQFVDLIGGFSERDKAVLYKMQFNKYKTIEDWYETLKDDFVIDLEKVKSFIPIETNTKKISKQTKLN